MGNFPFWQLSMATIHKLLFFLLVLNLLLSACGGSAAPTLGVAGMPTLVFIYTDG
jgi:hypothetical protein